jgi:hypothetical protein
MEGCGTDPGDRRWERDARRPPCTCHHRHQRAAVALRPAGAGADRQSTRPSPFFGQTITHRFAPPRSEPELEELELESESDPGEEPEPSEEEEDEEEEDDESEPVPEPEPEPSEEEESSSEPPPQNRFLASGSVAMVDG